MAHFQSHSPNEIYLETGQCTHSARVDCPVEPAWMDAPKRLWGLYPKGRVGGNWIAGHCLCPNVTANPGVSPDAGGGEWGGIGQSPPRAPEFSGGGATSQPLSPLLECWVRVGLGYGSALHLLYKSSGHAAALEPSRRSGWLGLAMWNRAENFPSSVDQKRALGDGERRSGEDGLRWSGKNLSRLKFERWFWH